ncbi:hypothetical protein ACH4UM_34865 [Streptomyces sp. NPDC020801]|uniref:hypothetical protein n=1 Tax=unclassified Streptomyces TaxID=2593676 RepID=UPI00378AB125
MRQAPDAGYSWTVIGERLGVSRQASRRRYADRVAHTSAAIGLIHGPDLGAGLAAARLALTDGERATLTRQAMRRTS